MDGTQNIRISLPSRPVASGFIDTSNRCPVVAFEYPDSGTSKMRQRYLKVVEASADYIKGYELDAPGSKKEGQFKTFCRTRIVQNGVALVSF